LRTYDLATGASSKPVYPDLGAMGTLSLSPDGRHALGAGTPADDAEPTVRLLDPATGKTRHTVPGNRGTFSPDGKLLITAGPDKRVHVFDPNTAKEVRAFDAAADGPLLVSHDNQTLVAVGDSVSVRNLADGTEPAAWKARRALGIDDASAIRGAAVSPDGKRLALGIWRDGSGDERFRVVVCETDSGRQLWDAWAGMYPATALAFSPDGKMVATGGWRVTLWDAATGRKARTLDGHRGTVEALLFRPDGKQLVSGGSDSNVVIWDVSR
jgi:WD40 repeat protein